MPSEEQCAYCFQRPATTWDHVIPRFWGGPDEDWNKLRVCRSCNSRKNNRFVASDVESREIGTVCVSEKHELYWRSLVYPRIWRPIEVPVSSVRDKVWRAEYQLHTNRTYKYKRKR